MALPGQKAHEARLKAMRSPRAQQLVTQALYVAGQGIELDAELSITAGSISGKGHVPSRPGTAPNADTRRLDSNIVTTITGALAVEVSSNAPYSAALEFGTSKMAERPFMRPAAAKNRGNVSALVEKAVAKVIRES